MVGRCWKTIFLLGRPSFRCYVSFREGKSLAELLDVSVTESGHICQDGRHFRNVMEDRRPPSEWEVRL